MLEWGTGEMLREMGTRASAVPVRWSNRRVPMLEVGFAERGGVFPGLHASLWSALRGKLYVSRE